MSFWTRLVNVVRGDGISREIDEELQTHIDEAVRQGRDPVEARRAFGRHCSGRRKPGCQAHSVAGVVGGRRRIRMAADGKKKSCVRRGDSVAWAGDWSVYRGIPADRRHLLRPLPIASPERLHVGGIEGRGGWQAHTYDSCAYPIPPDARRGTKSGGIDCRVLCRTQRPDVRSDQEMEKAYRQYVSGRMFGSFGLQPAAGRLFTDSDDLKQGAHPVAMISDDYWARRLGRDPQAVGRTFRMGDRAFRIVGVPRSVSPVRKPAR